MKPDCVSQYPIVSLTSLTPSAPNALTIHGREFLKCSKAYFYDLTRISKELQSDEVKSSEEWVAIFCRCIELGSEKRSFRALNRIKNLPLMQYAKSHYIDLNLLSIDLKKKWKNEMQVLKISANRHLFNGVVLDRIDYVKEAIESGANVNVTNGHTSVFSYAVGSGDKEIVSCLIKNGANVNHRNENNTTALHACFELSAIQRKFNYEIFELLLSLAPNEAQLLVYKNQIEENPSIMNDIKVQEIWGSFEEKNKLEKSFQLTPTELMIDSKKLRHKI